MANLTEKLALTTRPSCSQAGVSTTTTPTETINKAYRQLLGALAITQRQDALGLSDKGVRMAEWLRPGLWEMLMLGRGIEPGQILASKKPTG